MGQSQDLFSGCVRGTCSVCGEYRVLPYGDKDDEDQWCESCDRDIHGLEDWLANREIEERIAGRLERVNRGEPQPVRVCRVAVVV